MSYFSSHGYFSIEDRGEEVTWFQKNQDSRNLVRDELIPGLIGKITAELFLNLKKESVGGTREYKSHYSWDARGHLELRKHGITLIGFVIYLFEAKHDCSYF